MQDNAQQRAVNLKPTVIFDETPFSESVHKEVHAGPSCAHHFRQHLLRDFGDRTFRLIFFVITSEQQESAGEPLLSRVEVACESAPFYPLIFAPRCPRPLVPAYPRVGAQFLARMFRDTGSPS